MSIYYKVIQFAVSKLLIISHPIHKVRAQAARLQTNTVATHLENTAPHKISNNYLPNSYLLSFFQKKLEAPKLPLASLTPEYRALIMQNFKQIKEVSHSPFIFAFLISIRG